MNLTTDRTQIAAIAYTADEAADSFGFIFKHFNYRCINRDNMFIVDKDFTQLSSIEKYFPGCTILLCQFHTLKFMRTLLATALETVKKKNELYAMFKRVVYAPSEESYNAENLNYIEASTGVQIRINQTYRSLQDYYRKHWETCKKMWVKCFRKYLPLVDNTTNRVERTFWSHKQSLKDTFGGLPDTSSSIIHVINFADNRLKERYNYTAVKSLRIFDNNKTILSLNEAASQTLNDRGCAVFHMAQKNLEKHRIKLSIDSNGVEHVFDENDKTIYRTTRTSCTCTFYNTHEAPCMHMLFLRENENEGFSKDMFHIRYLKNGEDYTMTEITIFENEDISVDSAVSTKKISIKL